jgi:hypothetical protein
MPLQIDNRTLSLLITSRFSEVNLDSFSDEDWNLLINKMQSEGVAPLMYWAFSKAGRLSSLPQGVRNFLRVVYASTWTQNHKMFKELEILAHLFFQAEIPIVVLKGACYALTIYPDIGLRQMGDLDLLVPAAKLAQAVEIAKSLGYVDTLLETFPGLNDLLNHHVCLKKNDLQTFTLEIHDRLVGEDAFSYSVPVDWFWEQTQVLDMPSKKTHFEKLLMLTPEAQILYSACHAMLQHGGEKVPLRWYYDLDQLVRIYNGRMDWYLLLSQAKSFEWGSALDAALSRTIAYFDTPVPDQARADLLNSVDRHRSLVSLKQIHPSTHILEEEQKLRSLNWHGKFRLVMALILPNPAYMRWRYQLKNSWLLLFYYPFRWWGIIKDAVRTVFFMFKKILVTRI